jgi:hypothetical protein
MIAAEIRVGERAILTTKNPARLRRNRNSDYLPAKTQRPQRSEKMVKRIRKNIYLSPPNFAPLRLGGRNFQIREFSTPENFAPVSQIPGYSGTKSTKFMIENIRTLRVLRVSLRGE